MAISVCAMTGSSSRGWATGGEEEAIDTTGRGMQVRGEAGGCKITDTLSGGGKQIGLEADSTGTCSSMAGKTLITQKLQFNLNYYF